MTFTKLPKAISAEELLSTPLPPVKWIIPGLLPAGLALFAGPSKAGKSWLALWLCLQIAQGNPVWNREIEPRTVIYFSLEDTFNRLQNRIFQLIDGGDAPERLILQTECPSIGQGLEEQIDSLIYTYSDVGMIVIDTLQKVRVSDGNGGMYANDYKEAGALKKLADKYGICILLIHHLRKQSAADPFDQISGSTGLMGVADTSWVMQRKRMSQTADILLTGRDMDDRTLHLREDNCIWTLEDEETAEEREIRAVPDYLWKAAEYIESVGNWQGTASELLAAAGIENAKPNQFTYNMAISSLFEAYITNLGKYNEGRLVGETLKFPATTEEVQALLKRIGVDGVRYEEIFITSFDGDVLGLYDHLGEYESIDELNHLAHVLSDLDQSDIEKFEAVIDSGEYTGSVHDLINLAQNLDCYDFYPGIDSEEALGRAYIEEMEMLDVPDNVLPYFDFEAYGRDVRINEGGHFAPGGYVFNNGGSFVERYHGMEDIPPEHRIFAYPKLNIREQMAAYQEVIDRSALNEEKQRLPASREER